MSIIIRIPLIKFIQFIGTTKSIRMGSGLALVGSILVTFGSSYLAIVVAECIIELSKVFKGMLSVILKNNLVYQKLEDQFVRIQNKRSSIYELFKLYSVEQTAVYLGITVFISRIARVIGNLSFTKIYYTYKNKVGIIFATMIFSAYLFISVGYFIYSPIIKFFLMAIGFSLILMSRDPFKTYMQDIVLKMIEEKDHKMGIAYLEYSRKIGTTILSISVAITLIKVEPIYIIISLGMLTILQIYIMLNLYKLLKQRIN